MVSIFRGKTAVCGDRITERLTSPRFGKLRLHGTIRVGKDRQSWQELECYLFAEMLICVKEKKGAQPQYVENESKRKMTRCTLKGSILIKKHLKQVESMPGMPQLTAESGDAHSNEKPADEPVLTLNLSVNELPSFHLQFQSRNQLELWKRALLDLHNPEPNVRSPDYDHDTSGTDEDDYRATKNNRRVSVHLSIHPTVQESRTTLHLQITQHQSKVCKTAACQLPFMYHSTW